MKRILPFILIAFLFETSLLSAAEPIRVLTFNILYARWDKPAFSWEKRKKIVVDVMKNHPDGNGPYDFIGTQETGNDPEERRYHQIDYLAEAMDGYGSLYAPCRGRTDKYSLTNMIFYRKDRWEIDPDDRGHFWLSGTPEIPGSNDWPEGGRGGPRCVTYGLFHEIGPKGRTGRKVYFYNTHFSAHVDFVRKRSAILVMERLAARRTPDAPVILTGDFNSRHDTPQIAYMQGAPFDFEGRIHKPPLRLIETFKAVHPDSTEFGTIHGYRGKIDFDKKIDYIFVTEPLRPVAAKVVMTQKDGLYPSDHLPVDAVLEWD